MALINCDPQLLGRFNGSVRLDAYDRQAEKHWRLVCRRWCWSCTTIGTWSEGCTKSSIGVPQRRPSPINECCMNLGPTGSDQLCPCVAAIMVSYQPAVP